VTAEHLPHKNRYSSQVTADDAALLNDVKGLKIT